MPNFYLDLIDLLGISNIDGIHHNCLGKGVGKAILSIRNQFPSEDGEYVSFSESNEDEEKCTITDTD